MEAALKEHPRRAEAEELHRLATTRSQAYALGVTLERKHLAGMGRHSGLPSSNVLMNAFNNKQSTIDFEDFLGTESPQMPRPRQVVEGAYYGDELVTKPMRR
jgi:hypothetical protein